MMFIGATTPTLHYDASDFDTRVYVDSIELFKGSSLFQFVRIHTWRLATFVAIIVKDNFYKLTRNADSLSLTIFERKNERMVACGYHAKELSNYWL